MCNTRDETVQSMAFVVVSLLSFSTLIVIPQARIRRYKIDANANSPPFACLHFSTDWFSDFKRLPNRLSTPISYVINKYPKEALGNLVN